MRLIDADALNEKIYAFIAQYESMGLLEVVDDYLFVSSMLKTAPTIDAGPVVRCKDCKPEEKPLKIVEINPAVRKSVEANDGYCPCMMERTPETKCMCKEFREQKEPGPCHCGRYLKVLE